MNTTMKELRFGIEIETVGLSRDALARAIQTATGGVVERGYGDDVWQVTQPDGRGWRVVRDGSLSGGDRSGEIVSPILTYGDLEMLQAVVRSVRAAGAKTDRSTGIHIHVDGQRFDAKSAVNLVKFLHKQERLLEHVLGIQEYRLDHYCKPIDTDFLERLEAAPPATMAQLRALWYADSEVQMPTRYHNTRYRGLNLNSLFFRGTVEFRYFEASLHAGVVKGYVQLVLALAAYALRARTAHSKRREFNPATAKYDFRVVLLRLGLIGPEFKTARLHLTKGLAGSAAWKRGRPASAAAAAPATHDGDQRIAA